MRLIQSPWIDIYFPVFGRLMNPFRFKVYKENFVAHSSVTHDYPSFTLALLSWRSNSYGYAL